MKARPVALGWSAAQDQMAALSTNSTHWVADTTHVDLLDDANGSVDAVRAITAVVTAVRTGTRWPPDEHAQPWHTARPEPRFERRCRAASTADSGRTAVAATMSTFPSRTSHAQPEPRRTT